MLPFITLQPVDLGNAQKSLDTPEILAPEATEPTAIFADLLRLNSEQAGLPLPLDGSALPARGNALPPGPAPLPAVLPESLQQPNVTLTAALAPDTQQAATPQDARARQQYADPGRGPGDIV